MPGRKNNSTPWFWASVPITPPPSASSANNWALSYPLLSAFDAPEVVENYVGWLDREKRLSQRAYVLIDTDGIVRFVQVMQSPGEVLPVSVLEAELAKLTPAR